ncbi:TetR family transcriptional regulator [Nocardia tenerifensis]|uniref:TetR family transcriptional regulator n=1 Tax=Nocardia tenerifensis TaxID=228006 RepID=A0A318JNJ5_9NOCA|nr:TetR/AcrR family transcriptional regulator [Nocardia tenerifensis]PXX53303.1 TetR family transcriptional regulator [Nocardia tenerifensis]
MNAAERSAKRRAELVLAAHELFVDKGYRSVVVADIAARAGASHGTFYNYFDNKRDILDAVIDHYFALIRDRVFGRAITGQRPTTLDEFCELVAHIVDRCYELVEDEPGMVNFILLEAATIDDRVAERSLRKLRVYGDEAATRIERGIELGYLDPALDPRFTGEILLSTLLAALLSAIRGGAEGLDQARVRAELVAFLRATLAP